MRKTLIRKHRGSKFSEGSRLLWQTLENSNLTLLELAKLLGLRPNMVHRWIYGDVTPLGKAMTLMHQKLWIDPASWHRPPTEKFRLPANRGRGD